MNMKSFTDIEQSKVLAEILPPESADLWWTIIQPKKYEGWELVNDGESFTTLSFAKREHIALASYKEIPAWSLSALLDVLPSEVDDNHFLTLEKEGDEYCCCYDDINGNSFRHEFANNPIDSCYKMILRLSKNKLL